MDSTVMVGMLTSTGLGIYYTPLFFVLVMRIFAHKKP